MRWPSDGDWVGFFAAAPPEDAAWAVHLLHGGRLKRIAAADLRAALCVGLDLPPTVVDQSVDAVKDPALAAALMFDTLRTAPVEAVSVSTWLEGRLLTLPTLADDARQAALIRWFSRADLPTLRVMCRLALGGTVTLPFAQLRDAIAAAKGVDPTWITHRLLGRFAPLPADWEALVAPGIGVAPSARLDALPVEMVASPPTTPHPLTWAQPGPAVQLVKRAGEVHLWAEGARPRTRLFPEIAERAARLPDGTVLDGVLRPRVAAQERLSRTRLSPRMRATPVELLVTRIRAGEPGEFTRVDIHTDPPKALLDGAWRAGATGLCWRAPHADLVMAAPAREVIAALVYVQAGRRFIASFAVQHAEAWLPVAKIEVDSALYGWVKANTTERNGPVRVVPPVRRFRLAGALQPAPRRKARLWLEGARLIDETDAAVHTLTDLQGWLDE